MQRAEIVRRLESGFAESPRAAGIAVDGKLVEVFASQTGTWTILITKPGGLTCLVAVGDDWRRIDDPQGRRL